LNSSKVFEPALSIEFVFFASLFTNTNYFCTLFTVICLYCIISSRNQLIICQYDGK